MYIAIENMNINFFAYGTQGSNENIYIGFINMNHFYLLNVGNNQDNQMDINAKIQRKK